MRLKRLLIFSLAIVAGCGDIETATTTTSTAATTTTTTVSSTTVTTTTTLPTVDLSLAGYLVVYTSNRDRVINRGENVVLNLAVKNSGNASTNEVSVSCRTTNSNISTIEVQASYEAYTVKNPLSFGTIAAGATVSCSAQSNYLGFKVDNSCPTGEEITVNATISGAWLDTLLFTVEATDAALTFEGDYLFSSESTELKMQPGDTIYYRPYLSNPGSASTEGVNVYISSIDPYVTISGGQKMVSFGTMEPGVRTIVSEPVVFSVDASVPASREASLAYECYDRFGNSWSGLLRPILNGTGPLANFNHVIISKAVGQDNGQLNPGDVVDLLVGLRNAGTNPFISTLVGTMELTAVYATMVAGYTAASYPVIQTGEIGTSESAYRFIVSSYCPDGIILNFSIHATGEGYNSHLTFYRTVEAL